MEFDRRHRFESAVAFSSVICITCAHLPVGTARYRYPSTGGCCGQHRQQGRNHQHREFQECHKRSEIDSRLSCFECRVPYSRRFSERTLRWQHMTILPPVAIGHNRCVIFHANHLTINFGVRTSEGDVRKHEGNSLRWPILGSKSCLCLRHACSIEYLGHRLHHVSTCFESVARILTLISTHSAKTWTWKKASVSCRILAEYCEGRLQ